MRNWVVSLAALALAGCGSSNSTDFTLDVSGNASAMKQNLAVMHDQTLSLPGVLAATMTSDAEGLTFTIPAADGYDPAEIRMDFTQQGPSTRIAVAVDVPQVDMGAAQYLSEEKVEAELKKNLLAWKEQWRMTGDAASTKELQLTLALVALAAQQVDPAKAYMGGFDGFDFGAMESEAAGWGEDNELPERDYPADDGGWGADASGDGDDGGWGAGA